MGRHNRVLFTGGMGHWPRLERLILDASVPAASPPTQPRTASSEVYERIVMHPSLAVEAKHSANANLA